MSEEGDRPEPVDPAAREATEGPSAADESEAEDRPEPVDPAADDDGGGETAGREPPADESGDDPAVLWTTDEGIGVTPGLFTAVLVGCVLFFVIALGGAGLATVDGPVLPTVDELTGTPDTGPDASFDFRYNPEVGTVTITHDGGDPFTRENTDELYVAVGFEETEWALPVREGDTITVAVEPGDYVRVADGDDDRDDFSVPEE